MSWWVGLSRAQFAEESRRRADAMSETRIGKQSRLSSANNDETSAQRAKRRKFAEGRTAGARKRG